MNEFQTKYASEETVKGFILAAKSIAGVNLTPRDERMLESILNGEKVTDGGIEIVFSQSAVVMANRDFEAQYRRR